LVQLNIFSGIFLFVIASTKTNKTRPPSKAGKGKKLITARFKESIAVNNNKTTSPCSAAWPTYFTIPTGPETSSKSA
jgi:hypothetical protein